MAQKELKAIRVEMTPELHRQAKSALAARGTTFAAYLRDCLLRAIADTRDPTPGDPGTIEHVRAEMARAEMARAEARTAPREPLTSVATPVTDTTSDPSLLDGELAWRAEAAAAEAGRDPTAPTEADFDTARRDQAVVDSTAAAHVEVAEVDDLEDLLASLVGG